MGQLDASIVTVALPTLQKSFHASVGSVTWVGLSYLLVLVATVTAVGRFADMWGRKLLYIYGFLIFIGASVLCGLAPDLAALCGFRALQGLGAAMLQANSLAIIVLVVPRRDLGRAVGLQGAAQAIGLALGPSVGGLLLAAGGWRLIFFVNVPLGLLGALAALAFVPRSQNLQGKVAFDRMGLALFFPAVGALLVGISFGATEGWGSPLIFGLFVAFVVLAVLFVRHERADAEPMLDLGLFRSRRFSCGIVSGIGSYLVLFGVLLLVPFYLARGLGFGAARAGLELMALPVALGLVAPLAGRVSDRIGARRLTVCGMALVALGLVAVGLLRPGTPGLVLLLGLIGAGHDHGLGSPAAGRDGLWGLEHEPGDRHRIGAGAHRPFVFRQRGRGGRSGRGRPRLHGDGAGAGWGCRGGGGCGGDAVWWYRALCSTIRGLRTVRSLVQSVAMSLGLRIV
jgi:EmrB/QacA subfamily drug resistance transporter